MRCRDLEELLSAYADGELNRTQKEFIEEHLECCPDCRDTLGEFETAGRLISSLKEMPIISDIRGTTLSKIKAGGAFPVKAYRRWLRPVITTAVSIAVIAVMLATQPWEFRTPAASAATIARNSPEVQAFFDDEQIEEVEVTTMVIGAEGDVLVVLVKTETRTAAAEVNVKKKIVTNIIRVPDFQPDDEQRVLEIAGADPRVQEILSQGGTIKQTHLGYSIEGETAIATALLTIEQGKYEWNISINLREKTIISMGRGQPSPAMTAVYISEFVTRFVAPVLLLLGILIITGIAFKYRRARTIAGTAALVLGIIGLFMALYSLSSIWWRQVLSAGIPAAGLIIGIADLRQRGRRRWMAITGIVLGSVALLLVFLNDIMLYLRVPGKDIIPVIGTSVVIAGIVAYALYNQLKKIPFRWWRLAIVAGAAVITVVLMTIQPWSGATEPQRVLAKTSRALTEIRSYRMTYTSAESEGDTELITSAEATYAAPDSFYLTMSVGDWTREYTRIGENLYEKETGAPVQTSSAVIFNTAYIPDKETTLREIEELTFIRTLPDEQADGVECYRIRGSFSDSGDPLEGYLKQQVAEGKITESQYLQVIHGLDISTMTIDLWISKDDYLIRKAQYETRNKDGELIRTQTIIYSDFNKPITIEPPLDADGELLEGWEISNSDSGGGDVPYPTATPPAEPPNK